MLSNNELAYYTEIFASLDIDSMPLDEQMCIIMAQSCMIESIKPILDKYATENSGEGTIYNFVYRRKKKGEY